MQTRPHILLIRLKSIGDILFTRPAAHSIRSAFPDARICFLTSKQNAPLLEGFRDVDETIAIDKSRYRAWNPKGVVQETWGLLGRLRQRKFSLVIDFQGYGETALLSRLSFAPQRWGSLYSMGRRWAYTRAVARQPRMHPAEWNLEFLKRCGLSGADVRNEFDLSGAVLDEAARQFAAFGLRPDRPTLFIQPFTSTPHKNWPLERYLEIARQWRQKDFQILFGGGPSDTGLLQSVRDAGYVVASGSSLLLSAGLMKLSTLILGADTGMLHVAVAMGKRVVMLMTTSAPGSCHPFRHSDWAVTPRGGPAQPVSTIDAGQVFEACERGLTEAVREH